MERGFERTASIKVELAFSVVVILLKPVTRTTGRSGRMSFIFSASWVPLISGMVRSVSTMSNFSGFFLIISSASLGELRVRA